MAVVSTADQNDLSDDQFAYIEPGGTKDASGKTVPRSLRHFPIHDAAHVRNALSRAPQSPFGDKAMPAIKAAAKKFGIDVGGDSAGGSGGNGSSSRAESLFFRTYELEDIQIMRSEQGGDGRTVEAFAAPFDQEAEITDHEGHYIEVIDRTAFNRAIDHASRSARSPVRVMYNHGMTIHGTPAERFSIPIGVPLEIRADQRGLLTRTRYNETPLAQEILEAIRSGAITAQSFTGRIVRSDPQLRRGARYSPDTGGRLPTVRRMELGLREYGPTPFPAYSGAEILGVRMSTPGGAGLDPDGYDDASGTPPDEGPAAGDPQAPGEGGEHSTRSYHQHALYRLRSVELREKAGLVW